jgi:hypothetical protein
MRLNHLERTFITTTFEMDHFITSDSQDFYFSVDTLTLISNSKLEIPSQLKSLLNVGQAVFLKIDIETLQIID